MANDRPEQAARLYAKTYNCAQTVIHVFCEDLDPTIGKVLVDSAAGLGGGIASQGLACGAMIGGLMALNLRLIKLDVPENERSAAMKSFAAEFKRRNQHTDCADLTGMNFNDETLEHCRARVVAAVQDVENALAHVDGAGEKHGQ
jgi:C_GCAxxG_C_C family probable redox protein